MDKIAYAQFVLLPAVLINVSTRHETKTVKILSRDCLNSIQFNLHLYSAVKLLGNRGTQLYGLDGNVDVVKKQFQISFHAITKNCTRIR